MPPLDAFLVSIVDYAGLFPPAQLGMSKAVENFAGYAKGSHGGELGRFVISAARLGEFETNFAQLPQESKS